MEILARNEKLSQLALNFFMSLALRKKVLALIPDFCSPLYPLRRQMRQRRKLRSLLYVLCAVTFTWWSETDGCCERRIVRPAGNIQSTRQLGCILGHHITPERSHLQIQCQWRPAATCLDVDVPRHGAHSSGTGRCHRPPVGQCCRLL